MNRALKKLFSLKNPYEPNQDKFFFEAIVETVQIFYNESKKYREICNLYSFNPSDLKSISDLYKLPIITTQFLKRNHIEIEHNAITHVTSSGTSGKFSVIKYSAYEIYMFLKMAIRLGIKHQLFSFSPTHCVMLGYQPKLNNYSAISRTALASTFYSFTISRDYALQYKGDTYILDLDNIIQKMQKYSKGRLPIRIIGFPAYVYFLMQSLQQKGIKLSLPKGSKILFGGGWKQFGADEIAKEELYGMIKETLGIDSMNIHEFFGAAEHPILYCSCPNKHFHIPDYARVIIRNVKTLEALPYGHVGLVNLLTPVQSNIPIISIMTDDLGIVHEGKTCGCGIDNDYLEILGRVGVADIKTCTAGAKDYLGGK